MKNEKIINPPTLAFFIIFLNYGGLLIVLLINYFLETTEMADLGVFYLCLAAPI